MRTLKKWLHQKAINYITKDLLHLVDTGELLRIANDDTWFINGKKVEKNYIRSLQSDIEIFRKSTLWKLIREEGRRSANRNMFVNGQNEWDMQSGKMLLYYIAMIDKLLKQMQRKKK